MPNKIARRYRTILFAFMMSASTAFIVSGVIILMHAKPGASFVPQWMGAFITAWPIVFVAILIIAPLVNKLLNLFVE